MARRALSICTSAEIGGMERLAVGITRQLALRGWAAELIFGEGPQAPKLVAWSESQGVSASTSPAVASVMERRRSWSSVWELVRLVRSKKPDVLILHYGGAHISSKDVLAARLARIPRCIAHVHLPVDWTESGRRKRLLTRLAASLTDGVVVHSQAVKDVVAAAGVPRRKIHKVNPGVACPAQTGDRARARRDFGLAEDTFVVGCMARLVTHKGVADLVAAMAATPPGTVLLVAGDGPQRAALELLASRSAPGRVKFLGTLEGTDAFFAALDLFVLPSHREGFGLVLIEAAMRGVPAVGSRIGGIEDAIVDGETGVLVPAGDSAALAHAITALRASPSRREHLAAAAKLRALRDFSEEAMGAAEERVLVAG